VRANKVGCTHPLPWACLLLFCIVHVHTYVRVLMHGSCSCLHGYFHVHVYMCMNMASCAQQPQANVFEVSEATAEGRFHFVVLVLCSYVTSNTQTP
jgi:hypothetical protein